MKKYLVAALALEAVLILFMLASFYIAAWSEGDAQRQWMNTGLITVFAAFIWMVAAFGIAEMCDSHARKDKLREFTEIGSPWSK